MKNNNTPPRLGQWILRHIIPDDEKKYLLEGIEERYLREINEKGKLTAFLWYLKDILLTVPFIIMDNFFRNAFMFKNFFKITLRNIKRYKVFSLINITSLALGLAYTILTLIWVEYEFSYDRFHENFNEIYRITTNYQSGEQLYTYPNAPEPLCEVLKNELPEVADYVRYASFSGSLRIETGEQIDYDNIYAYVDPSFFEIFSFPLIRGEPTEVLKDKYSVVLNEKTAEKYFGKDDPIGKTILVREEKIPCTVTGIAKNFPENSHVKFDILLNNRVYDYLGIGSGMWTKYSFGNYLLVRNGTDIEVLENKMLSIIKRHDMEAIRKFELQPMKDIHLRSYVNKDYSNYDRGDIKEIILFSIISVLVLLTACINFMSLSTANSMKRAKEVGIRKVCGAARNDLVRQFYGESVMFAFIALLFAIVLSVIFLPFLRQLSGRALDLNLLNKSSFVLILFSITVFTGIVSGSYPALFLSSFKPVSILKNVFSSGKISRFNFRKILVTVQYIFTIMLLTGAIVIYFQLYYIVNKDLGYDEKNIVIFPFDQNIRKNLNVFTNELKLNPNIMHVATGFPPTMRDDPHHTSNINWDGKDPEEKIEMVWTSAEYGYFETLGMELVSGRFFSRAQLSDTLNFVLNETAVKVMGIEDPVGKRFTFGRQNGKIIGIVKDYHIASMRANIIPLLFVFRGGQVMVKISPVNQTATLKYMGKIWKKFTERPFLYSFLDGNLDGFYRKERKISTILKSFTVLALIIFCLGLVGLISFTSEQKTKEIGIRKVLGAKINNLMFLIYNEFSFLLLIAFIIACPAAYYIMYNWLSNFAYRIGLSWWIFALSGFMTLTISLITVSYQTVKAARKNPVDSLRYE